MKGGEPMRFFLQYNGTLYEFPDEGEMNEFLREHSADDA